MRCLKTSGLLTQVSEKCTFGGLRGQSHNRGGLKDRFDCYGHGVKCNYTPSTWRTEMRFLKLLTLFITYRNQLLCKNVSG